MPDGAPASSRRCKAQGGPDRALHHLREGPKVPCSALHTRPAPGRGRGVGPRELPGSSEGPQKTRRPCMALGQFVLPEASMDQMTILGQLIRISDPRGPSPGLRGRGGGGALKGRAVGSLKSADQADATQSRAYYLLPSSCSHLCRTQLRHAEVSQVRQGGVFR